MDPLSTAASVLAVLSAAGATVRGLEKVWALKDAPKEVEAVRSAVTKMRVMLRSVELALHSIPTNTAENPAIQDVLHNIDNLHKQAFMELSELDSLIEKLQSTTPTVTASCPKVAKWPWLRQSKNLEKLQSQISGTTQALCATMMALNTIQLGNLQSIAPLHIKMVVQDISLLNIDDQQIIPSSSQSQPLYVQLDQVIRHSMVSPSSHQPFLEAPNSMVLSEEPPLSKKLISKAWEPSSSVSVHNYTNTTVRVTTSLSNEKCDPFCQCHCHITNQIKTPRWAKGILGAMCFSSNTTVLLNRRPCNIPAICRRSGQPSAQFTYYAPPWILSKAFHFTMVREEVNGIGAHFAVKIPRIITGPNTIWRLISTGAVKEIQEAIKEKLINVSDVSSDGESLLHFAARTYQDEVCAFLIEQGADYSYCSYLGIPAYELGLDHVLANPPGHRNLPDSKVSRFAEIFANEGTWDDLDLTSIHRIVLGITSADLDAQLKLSNSEIDIPDAGGRTPLMWAARRGDIQSIRTLLKWGADVEKCDRSMSFPIHKAVADADDECVHILLETGADATVADDGGGQAIHNIFFSPFNRTKSIKALLEHGVNINARCIEQNTALHWAVNTCKTEGRMDNIRYMIDHGANIDAINNIGDSPVNDAISTNDLRMLELLIERGAALDRKRKLGTTALHLAAWTGNLECWGILTDAARVGKFEKLDLDAMHEKHDIWHCLDKCRGKWFVGERQPQEVEKHAFKRLIRAIEGHIEEEVSASADISFVDDTKDSTVLIEQAEFVMTDNESIYADAEEVLCF